VAGRSRESDLGDASRARESMVRSDLVARGIRDRRVLSAMASVPRERFVPDAWRREAYTDRPLPIGHGQTISQPYMIAVMLETLDCGPEHVVLEVGAGSGYQAALLGRLCAEVWAVEIVEELAERARPVLFDLGFENVHIVVGDGTGGLPEHAPWDRVIVAAGAPDVPGPLVDQLADGGRLVIPVGGRVTQRLAIVDRRGEEVSRQEGMPCVFVPLIGRHGWRPDG